MIQNPYTMSTSGAKRKMLAEAMRAAEPEPIVYAGVQDAPAIGGAEAGERVGRVSALNALSENAGKAFSQYYKPPPQKPKGNGTPAAAPQGSFYDAAPGARLA